MNVEIYNFVIFNEALYDKTHLFKITIFKKIWDFRKKNNYNKITISSEIISVELRFLIESISVRNEHGLTWKLYLKRFISLIEPDIPYLICYLIKPTQNITSAIHSKQSRSYLCMSYGTKLHDFRTVQSYRQALFYRKQ